MTTEKEARTDNTGFASGGVTCKLGALCFYSSSVLIDSFVLRFAAANRPNAKPETVGSNPLFAIRVKFSTFEHAG